MGDFALLPSFYTPWQRPRIKHVQRGCRPARARPARRDRAAPCRCGRAAPRLQALARVAGVAHAVGPSAVPGARPVDAGVPGPMPVPRRALGSTFRSAGHTNGGGCLAAMPCHLPVTPPLSLSPSNTPVGPALAHRPGEGGADGCLAALAARRDRCGPRLSDRLRGNPGKGVGSRLVQHSSKSVGPISTGRLSFTA